MTWSTLSVKLLICEIFNLTKTGRLAANNNTYDSVFASGLIQVERI